MKKKNILLLFLLCATSLLLVGCGEKESNEDKESSKTEKKEEKNTKSMSCTLMEEDFEDMMKLTMTMDFEYDEKKQEVVSGNLKTTMTVTSDDLSDEDMDIFKETDFCKDGTLEDFDDYATSCKTNVSGKTLTSVVQFDIDKLDEASNEDGTFRKDMTLEEIQESLKSEYDETTCTIK